MSYSIFVPFENESEKERMRVFLNEHFRTLDDILDMPSESFNSHPPHDDLTYTGFSQEPFLGYNYGINESDIEQDYRYAICYWMAIHGGKREKNIPILMYDGYTKIYIHTDFESVNPVTEYTFVNKYGYRKISTLTLFETYPNETKEEQEKTLERLNHVNNAIKNELKRLHTLWENSYRKHLSYAKLT